MIETHFHLIFSVYYSGKLYYDRKLIIIYEKVYDKVKCGIEKYLKAIETVSENLTYAYTYHYHVSVKSINEILLIYWLVKRIEV